MPNTPPFAILNDAAALASTSESQRTSAHKTEQSKRKALYQHFMMAVGRPVLEPLARTYNALPDTKHRLTLSAFMDALELHIEKKRPVHDIIERVFHHITGKGPSPDDPYRWPRGKSEYGNDIFDGSNLTFIPSENGFSVFSSLSFPGGKSANDEGVFTTIWKWEKGEVLYRNSKETSHLLQSWLSVALPPIDLQKFQKLYRAPSPQ